MTSTVYDDVFRTLLNDCSALIIPVINELFNEHYSGKELIEFRPNEHFMNQQDGNETKRITDTYFVIHSEVDKGYHLECQSTSDSTMLLRMFEYDSQIALDTSVLDNNTLHVKFPNSALLYLRSTSATPESMRIVVEFPKGLFGYDVPVMQVKNYSLEKILNKGLLFLLPFYIFSHEKNFEAYEHDSGKLASLLEEYKTISQKLDNLVQAGTITEYVKCTIQDMTGRVAEQLAEKYTQVQKGVRSIMIGKVLDYEAKDILQTGINQGRAEGIVQGITQGRLTTLIELVHDKILSLSQASQMAKLSEDEFSRLAGI